MTVGKGHQGCNWTRRFDWEGIEQFIAFELGSRVGQSVSQSVAAHR